MHPSGSRPPRSAQAQEYLHRLWAIRTEIEKIKGVEPDALVRDIEHALDRLQKPHPAAFARVGERTQHRRASNL